MDYKKVTQKGADVVLEQVQHFHLATILDCGQSFRWEPTTAAGGFSGVVQGLSLTISQQENEVCFHNTTMEEFREIWIPYFDLERDYGAVKQRLVEDGTLAEAVGFCPGMRVLRQPPWETLCSFIISQNNNIPRIKGIISRLCSTFGTQLPEGGYAFPSPETMALLTPEDLAPVRAGFRARYLLDAAQKVASGELELEPLYTLPLPEARSRLQTICGVGPKVAECVLLYGFARSECFPVDVWIGRVLEEYYPHGFPEHLGPWAGIAQQYLFHYIRNLPKNAAS